MTGAREIGVGIARALSHDRAPNPFPLSFTGETVKEAADIVSAILRECEDAGIKLEEVKLDAELFERVRGQSGGTSFRLVCDATLNCEVRFIRS